MTNFRSGHASALRRLHLAADALVIVGSMYATALLHAPLRRLFPAIKETAAFAEHALLVYFALPLWIFLIYLLGLHLSFERVWRRAELLKALAKLHFAAFWALAGLQFLTQSIVNRSLVALFLVCTFVLLYVERRVFNAWAHFQHVHGYAQERLVVIGEPSQRMGDFARHLLAGELPPRLLGYLHEEKPEGPEARSLLPGQLPWLGRLAELEQVLHQKPVDHVLFFPPYHRPEQASGALTVCENLGVPTSFAVDLVQLSRFSPRVATVAGHPFITFDAPPERGAARALKYALDPLLAAVLLLLLSPLLVGTALTILLTMGRPVLFVQERAGLYGRGFRMFKFRTMVRDAESQKASLHRANEMEGPTFKMRNDPRVTSLGRFLRKTSIDELPQLLNVLVGTMSVVGPRPLPLAEQEQIRGLRRRRLSMKPGITCLWQVSGRSDLGFEEWMLLDLKYIEEWSLGLDLQILLKTLPVVLFCRGAR